MAYGKKYTLTFSDRLSNIWLLEIYKNGFAGSARGITGTGTPLGLSYRGSDDLLDPIKPSELLVNLVASADLEYIEFMEAVSLDFYCLLKKNGTAWWTGQIVPENYTEPYNDTPYPLTIRFSDIGDLSFYDFVDGSGNFFTGNKTLSEILFQCLNKLAVKKNIYEIINILEKQNKTDGYLSMLASTRVDCRAFIHFQNEQAVAMTCFEVIKRIMRSSGCRFFQHENYWWVIRIEEMKYTGFSGTLLRKRMELDSTTFFPIGTSAPLYAGGTQTDFDFVVDIDKIPETGVTYIEREGEFTRKELITEIEYKYNGENPFRKSSDLIFNPDFRYSIPVGKVAAYWELSADLAGVPTAVQTADKKLYFKIDILNNSAMFQAESIPLGFNTNINKLYLISGNPLSSVVAQHNVNQLLNIDKIKINIKGVFQKAWDTTTYPIIYPNVNNLIARMGILIKNRRLSDSVTRWAQGTIGYNAQTGLTWSSTAACITYDTLLDGTPPSSCITNIGASDHPFDIAFEIATPQTGETEYEIWFFVPRSFNPVSAGGSVRLRVAKATFENISAQFIADETLPSDINFFNSFITVPEPKKKNVYEIEVFLGDGPTGYAMTTFRQFIQNTESSLWKYKSGAIDYSAREIFISRVVASIMSKIRTQLSLNIFGEIGFVNSIELDGVRYVQDTSDYDIKASAYRTQMQKIMDETTDVVTEVISPVVTDVSAGNAGITSTGGNIQPLIDEKIHLLTGAFTGSGITVGTPPVTGKFPG